MASKIKFFIFLAMALIQCKKESSSIKYPGINYTPIQENNYLAPFRFAGFNESGTSFNFYFQNAVYTQNYAYYRTINNVSYNFQNQLVNVRPNLNLDSGLDIGGIVSLNSGLNFGFSSNHAYGKPNGTDQFKLLLLTNDLKIIKERRIGGSVIKMVSLKQLSNGNLMAVYTTWPYNARNRIMCLSPDLDSIWGKDIEIIGPAINDYEVADVFTTNNSIYILQNTTSLNASKYFRIKEYSITGNLIKTYISPNEGQRALTFFKTPVNFGVFATSFDAAAKSNFSIQTFDNSLNLLKNVTLPASNLYEANGYIDYTFIDYNMSNILFHSNHYYLSLLIKSNSQNSDLDVAKLIKLNENFEFQWAKPLPYPSKYLLSNADNIISVGLSKKNKITGIGFVKLNKEGNVVK